MTQFKDKTWTERYRKMGDEAEGVYEDWATIQGTKWARYGLNRPDFNVAKLPIKLRYTPDYITAKSLVEVQGFGKDQKIKLKEEKLLALMEWHKEHPTCLWLYNNVTCQCVTVSVPDMFVASLSAVSKSFPEGKPYYEWDADFFAGWTDCYAY